MRKWRVRLVYSKSLHDCARSEIDDSSKGYDFWQSESLEPNAKRAACRFRCEAFAPMLCGQPPAHLHTGSEWKCSRRDMQPGKADKLTSILCF